MERELSALGRAVAERQDAEEAAFDFEAGRGRLLASVAATKKKKDWARFAWAAAAVPLVIALARVSAAAVRAKQLDGHLPDQPRCST